MVFDAASGRGYKLPLNLLAPNWNWNVYRSRIWRVHRFWLWFVQLNFYLG